ncbi:Juvenile hormone acid O-methyltransferase [Eumeta japonica]|uniref:Juvenile hormone acid O-methyltransferase n=1 Tax=Eumeta variegata TaxID=151549 RepID=A0A4C1X3V6_EUMVA|nr:Juvenile hormone acid O-methyltransferase [Eumeta japonica]
MKEAELYKQSNDLQRRDAEEVLKEYSAKIFWKEYGDRVLDVGCGDGSVTVDLLRRHMPLDFKRLLGCDISETMVKHANRHHRDYRTEFSVLDIEGPIPEDLIEKFDHVFSFYTLHWIRQQEKAFRNIYSLLDRGGECLLVFLGYMPIYDVYRRLSEDKKWSGYMKDVDKYISPYHNCVEPETDVRRLMERIGFRDVDVQCRNKKFIYEDIDTLKKAVTAVNPFNLSSNLQEEFLEDYLDIVKEMHLMDETNNNVEDNAKTKTKSLDTAEKSEVTNVKEECELDILIVEIYNLIVPDLEQCEYSINVQFEDKVIIESCIKAVGNAEATNDKTLAAKGSMSYDPSDYQSMCMMADFPLVVTIQPSSSTTGNDNEEKLCDSSATSNTDVVQLRAQRDTNSCIVDVLPALVYQQNLWVEKRMEPTITPSVLEAKSWDNLPVLWLKVYVERCKGNSMHHDFLKTSNWVTITVLSAYNVTTGPNEDSSFSVGTQIPIQNDEKFHILKYNNGTKNSKCLDSLNTYMHWESLRSNDSTFTIGDEKLVYDFDDIINETKINIKHYMINERANTLVWNSFHRGLLPGDSSEYLKDHIRRYKWPLELTMTTESETLSFMAHMDLFRLLYAGENTVLSAVPLRWYDADEMLIRCGLQTLLTPLDSMVPPEIVFKNIVSDGSSSSGSYVIPPTGADKNCAWILVQIKLGKPLKPITVPHHISQSEINQMLKNTEENEPDERNCNGRGHGQEWQNTVHAASEALLRVAYYNVADFCAFSRQLSTTRTRVEVLTSFWQDAALYVNDNFLVNNFLGHNDAYKEMLLLAHIGLMRKAEAVLNEPAPKRLNPKLRAARHARQLQDIKHATDLYLEYVSQNPELEDGWRELGTCLREVDKDYALVCSMRSLRLNVRHPLTCSEKCNIFNIKNDEYEWKQNREMDLCDEAEVKDESECLLSTGTLVFEEDPRAAEQFFLAILELYPLWTLGCVAASVYYYKMESFDTAEQIMVFVKKNRELEMCWDIGSPRNWETELGDWWEHTAPTPRTSVYHHAADLLLRFRAIPLAEVCIALALNEGLETATYYHQAALCCRLKREVSSALCFIRTGLEKFGEISYLRSLEVECLLKLEYREAAADSAKRVGSSINPFTMLIFASVLDSLKARPILNDLVQRQPNAYAWTAMADDWLERSKAAADADASDGKMAESYAAACAVQALKIDRRAARAWALLARLVRPKARRQHCRKMAELVRNINS